MNSRVRSPPLVQIILSNTEMVVAATPEHLLGKPGTLQTHLSSHAHQQFTEAVTEVGVDQVSKPWLHHHPGKIQVRRETLTHMAWQNFSPAGFYS